MAADRDERSQVDVKVEVPERNLIALSVQDSQRIDALLVDAEEVVTFQVPDRFAHGIQGRVSRDAATALMALAQGHDVRAVLDSIAEAALSGSDTQGGAS